LVAGLDRKRLGQALLVGRRSRSEAFSYYVGTDYDIYILILNHVTVYPNGSMWAAGSIMQGTTVYSCGGPDLTAFTEVVNGQLSRSVFYVANDGNLHRLWAQPGWQDMNLTGGQVFSAQPRNFCINYGASESP
jgi:hypothetical protein